MKRYLSTILMGALFPIAATFTLSQVQSPLLINGQVVDEKGSPIANANVYAMPDALYGALPASMSDAQGRFTIQVAYASRYKLSAVKLADDYASLFSTLHYPSDTRPQVIVKADETVPLCWCDSAHAPAK